MLLLTTFGGLYTKNLKIQSFCNKEALQQQIIIKVLNCGRNSLTQCSLKIQGLNISGPQSLLACATFELTS
ncbi:hypothetical protein T01_2973 [Trichinella spiralis]|uniref:Uncharacterized protein n=1 Tax=Trichinella spiralis TaxID=6334 RepID=A0A0V1AQY3_TRISP|nr:hypothetical protein T01_11827 [Trichinella spiralis]KRY26700.1 hypothetical protein T01_2973 [Trichinella spiralis]